MSFKGTAEVQCPNGCQPFEVHVWSMIRLDKNPELRELLLAGELNLLVCRHCHRHFYYDQTVVIHDPRVELLAFVFPSYSRSESDRWKAKMDDDYAQLQKGLGPDALDYPPRIFFGLEDLRELLEKEDDVADEVEIARHLARTLRLELYPVKASYARDHDMPMLLPCLPAAPDTRTGILDGLARMLEENPYLVHYQRAMLELKEKKPSESLPPAARSSESVGK